MDNDNKHCDNCKHFIQYCVWSANRYSTVNCGHCLKDLKICKSPLIKCCENWELKNIDIIKRKQILTFKQAMLDMVKKVDEIIARLDYYDNK